MPKFLVVYHNAEISNSVTFEYSESLAPYTKMLRDLGYSYEVYCYYSDKGYIRTVRYKA